MSGKLLDMRSKAQLWSDVFRGRKPETPKYNKAEFDAMFGQFTRDIDKVEAELYPGDPGPEPLAEPITAEDAEGYVGEDGGWIPDWRDEEPYHTDTLAAMEREKGFSK